jgi:prolipoprotein diacylglyceryl transferase
LLPLASIPSPTQGVWHLGSIPIRAYAICIVLGIIVACWVTDRRLRSRGAPALSILDVAVWAVPFGIVGARIYHVLTTPSLYFGANGHFVDAFKIWQGGLGIWGAVFAGAFGAWIAARRLGLPLSMIADSLAVGLPLAQAVGRWGNWFNNELYGRQTSLPWGLKIYNWDSDNGRALTESDTGHPILKGIYQPTFLYESLWDVGTAVLVWALDRKYKFGKGRAFALYVMAYTVGRFWIEALRSDDAAHFLGMRLNDWTSIIVFLGALIFFLRVKGPREYVLPGPDGRFNVVTEAEYLAGVAASSADSSTEDDPEASAGDDPDATEKESPETDNDLPEKEKDASNT